MIEALNAYQALSTVIVTVVQRLGLLSVPIGIGIGVLINMWGGTKAIAVVGSLIFALAIFSLILTNVLALASFVANPATVAATLSSTPVPVP